MKMSREQKYRLIEEAGEEELTLLKQQVKQSPWRQAYHIQPHTGLLNDPNGFAYYQGDIICSINGSRWVPIME